MKKTNYKPLIPICSDEELKDIAEQWCDLVGTEPTNTTLNAFMMGAKIAISNNGWVVNQNKDGKDPNAIYDWGSFPLEKNFEWKNQNKDE